MSKRSPITAEEQDQTLEILMTDLDSEVMSIFTKEECLNATEATKVDINLFFYHYSLLTLFSILQKSGIDKIIPNMVIDDFLFDPCGYSMNGINKNVSFFYTCPATTPTNLSEN